MAGKQDRRSWNASVWIAYDLRFIQFFLQKMPPFNPSVLSHPCIYVLIGMLQ